MIDIATDLFKAGLTTADWVSIACSLSSYDAEALYITCPQWLLTPNSVHESKRLEDHRELSRAPVPKQKGMLMLEEEWGTKWYASLCIPNMY